jgi:hypothetical protein
MKITRGKLDVLYDMITSDMTICFTEQFIELCEEVEEALGEFRCIECNEWRPLDGWCPNPECETNNE